MSTEIIENMPWLGDPNVTLVSDDGYKFLCHQIILGIYDNNLKSILTHNKMTEYIFLFQSINYTELKEYIHTIYSSFNRLIEKHKENIFDDQIKKYTVNDEHKIPKKF